MKNMKYPKFYWLLIGFLFFFGACNNGKDSPGEKQDAKFVFYFIADGMSDQHVKLTEAFLHASDDQGVGFEKLAFDTLPVYGTSTTHAHNRLITGSAAAGTALATGHKTNINTIAMHPEDGEALQSIAGVFKEDGKKVGIISSVSIDHATPAVFYANQQQRSEYFEIGRQLPESGFDFFGGGGFKIPQQDSIDLYELAAEKNYQVLRKENQINDMEKGRNVLLVNPVLGRDAEMPYAIDRKYEGGLSLARITEKAIEHLYSDAGFFIMIEGGKIDWAAHAKDAATIVREMIDFDKSVQQALNFYLEHPDETLIVVTSDHETGGLALGNDEMHYESNFGLLKNQRMSAERVSKLLHQEQIKHEDLPEIFGIEDFSDEEQEMINTAAQIEGWSSDILYGGYAPLPVTFTRILNKRAGVGFTSWSHTAGSVPVFAIGAGAEEFSGQMDNTDIPKRLLNAAGLSF